jgi:hypothetical protein
MNKVVGDDSVRSVVDSILLSIIELNAKIQAHNCHETVEQEDMLQ